MRATCYNLKTFALCLVDVDEQGRVLSSSAVSFPAVDGTPAFDKHFRRLAPHIHISRDDGRWYRGEQKAEAA